MSSAPAPRPALRPLLAALLLSSTAAPGALQVFDAAGPGDSLSIRGDWLSAIGEAPPVFIDFESGFSDGQDMIGVTVAGLMTISDPDSLPVANISSGAGLGGGNPLGNLALQFDNRATLDFSGNPVDYLGLYYIDAAGPRFEVFFEGGGSEVYSADGTAASGDSAEFIGFYRNDQPRITQVNIRGGGSNVDGDWGIDNVELGSVPEPTSATLTLLGLMMAVGRRRRRVS